MQFILSKLRTAFARLTTTATGPATPLRSATSAGDPALDRAQTASGSAAVVSRVACLACFASFS